MKHLISPLDLSVDELDHILTLGQSIMHDPQAYAHVCDGKKLATLFYEPSTRTRLSFEAAMLNLGGSVLGFSSADSSSASKGESVADTIRVISSYADICAMRHPKEGAPTVAAMHSRIPVINAGDGGHNHPTQTLTDLLTIIHFILISPDELRIPDYLRQEVLVDGNIDFIETNELEKYMPKLDILYMTRVQRERFFNEEDYIRLKDSFILDAAKMRYAKENMYVLHPLPRVNEIATEVDDDPRAVYFKQAQFGVYVRMALIMTLLGLAK